MEIESEGRLQSYFDVITEMTYFGWAAILASTALLYSSYVLVWLTSDTLDSLSWLMYCLRVWLMDDELGGGDWEDFIVGVLSSVFLFSLILFSLIFT